MTNLTKKQKELLINLISEQTKEIIKNKKCIIDGKFIKYKRAIRKYKEFENIVNTQYFENLIREHLINNYSSYHCNYINNKVFYDSKVTKLIKDKRNNLIIPFIPEL